MDILDKVRAQIAYHEAEIEKLRIAEEVILGVDKKAATAKPAPMFTVRKVAGTKATKKQQQQRGSGGISVNERILAAVRAYGPAMTAKEIRAHIDLSDRKPNSLYTSLGDLMKMGKLTRDGNVYLLAQDQAEESPTERTSSEDSESGHAIRAA